MSEAAKDLGRADTLAKEIVGLFREWTSKAEETNKLGELCQKKLEEAQEILTPEEAAYFQVEVMKQTKEQLLKIVSEALEEKIERYKQ